MGPRPYATVAGAVSGNRNNAIIGVLLRQMLGSDDLRVQGVLSGRVVEPSPGVEFRQLVLAESQSSSNRQSTLVDYGNKTTA